MNKRQVHRNWDEVERIRHGQQVSERFAKERESKLANCIEVIESLISKGITVTQNEVARQTGLSVGFVNKHLKDIIDQANKRQRDKGKKPVLISSVNALEKDLETLRLTNQRLQLEVSKQKRINKELLAQVSMVVVLKSENEVLRNQCRELMDCLQAYEQKVIKLPSPIPDEVTKSREKNAVTKSVKNNNEKSSNSNSNSDSNSNIFSEIEDLGIKINSTLSKTIRGAAPSAVEDAIAAYKQALESDEVIKSPGGWLKSAIENGWTKNYPQQQSCTSPPIYAVSESESSEELLDPSQVSSLIKEIKNE